MGREQSLAAAIGNAVGNGEPFGADASGAYPRGDGDRLDPGQRWRVGAESGLKFAHCGFQPVGLYVDAAVDVTDTAAETEFGGEPPDEWPESNTLYDPGDGGSGARPALWSCHGPFCDATAVEGVCERVTKLAELESGTQGPLLSPARDLRPC